MYYLVFSIFYLFSLLPLRVMYGISDLARVFLYYITPYRKKIVLSNLAIAFPEKTEEERKKIAWDFYRNFIDHFLETIKLLSARKAFLRAHFAIDNPEMLEDFFRQQRRCQLHLGHTFNWEYANNWFPYSSDFPFIVIYMPIASKIFDRLFHYIRTRTGAIQVPATNTRHRMLAFRNQLYLLALVADQAPGSPENAYWLNFFGKPAPFVRSPERGARSGNTPAVFVHFYKTARGKYRTKLLLASDQPAGLPEGELTIRYVRFLEWSIREQPALYLWTHRRWKHAWKEEYRRLMIGGK
jgi:KDO2-lipid IV(A) lauroyltransferase